MQFNKQIRELSGEGENKICIDCKIQNTHWASTSYGIFFCLECASRHRSFGVTISRVKSVTMDNWNEQSYIIMQKNGNKKFREYIEYNGLGDIEKDLLYKHDIVKQYKMMVCGKEEEQIKEKYVAPPVNTYKYDDRQNKSNGNMKEYIGEKAIQLKTKGFEFGSKLNKNWLSPTAVLLKDTFRKVKEKIYKKEEKGERVEYEGIKPVKQAEDDMSKWD